MQTEFIAVPPSWTVGQTIDYMRETEDLPERFFEIYVVEPAGKFLGAVPLDRLMRTKRPVPMSELMEPERHVVRATDDQEEVARLFERYNLVAAPVVDDDDRMVGVITFDDIVDVIEEEAEEDIKALGGVKGEEELSDSVWTIAKSRFNWLLVNLATAFLASSVLGLFEGELQKMVALAVLAPIVASQGGNAATQTMTVAVRALATRELVRRQCLARHHARIDGRLLNGIAFAVITGVAAYAWFKVPGLGVVIGLAMICNLIAAALGGILIPLALHRLRRDPAVSSSLFVTTVTDIVGFFSFLGDCDAVVRAEVSDDHGAASSASIACRARPAARLAVEQALPEQIAVEQDRARCASRAASRARRTARRHAAAARGRRCAPPSRQPRRCARASGSQARSRARGHWRGACRDRRARAAPPPARRARPPARGSPRCGPPPRRRASRRAGRGGRRSASRSCPW